MFYFACQTIKPFARHVSLLLLSRPLSVSMSSMPTVSMMADMVKTRILVLSDTHNALPFPSTQEHAFREPLPPADVVLHAGDLTMTGKIWEYERAIKLLEGIDAKLKIVIAGNHDLTLHREFFEDPNSNARYFMGLRKSEGESLPGQARELWTGQRAAKAGIKYVEEGVSTFEVGNGAKLTVSLTKSSLLWIPISCTLMTIQNRRRYIFDITKVLRGPKKLLYQTPCGS